MANITVKRPLAVTTSEEALVTTPGFLSEASEHVYLPFVFDDFATPNQSITGCTLTNGATKIVGTAGKFDDVRVGDIIVSASTGTLTAKSTVTRDCSTFTGLKYVVYPSTNNAGNLGVQVGDAVSGTGIPANTVVDRIDHSTRRIFLDKAATAVGAEVTLTFTPPIRVTAVRKSTATANANEIDIDTTVASTGSNSTVVVKNGANEAVPVVFRITSLGSDINANVTFKVAAAKLDGLGVQGAAAGFNGLTYGSLTYIGVGDVGFNADTFLTNARFLNVD